MYPQLKQDTQCTGRPQEGGAIQTRPRSYREERCVHTCTLRYTRVYTMVYTRVYSTPVLCRLLPFFSEGICADPVVVSPQSAYTVYSRVITLSALGYLHCMLWGCLHYECWGNGDYVANG